MSRLLAYLGSPVLLSSVIIEHPHSLIEQSYAPQEMVTGTINADGFGFGWYAGKGGLPGTYHRATPIWSDPDLPRFGRVIESGCIFAAIRNATPGFPVELQNVQPYVYNQYLFLHNGAVEGFNRRFRRPLLDQIPEDIQAITLGSADSDILFALALTCLQKHAACEPGAGAEALQAALEFTFRTVLDLAREEKARAALNMGLTDGHSMAFVRLARGIEANSLYLRKGKDSVWVASEPLDSSDQWEEVPEASWVLVDSPESVEVKNISDLPPKKDWK